MDKSVLETDHKPSFCQFSGSFEPNFDSDLGGQYRQKYITPSTSESKFGQNNPEKLTKSGYEVHLLEVTSADQGLNLLAFLRKHLGKERSVKSLKRLVDGKSCQVNGRVEWFSTHPLKPNDRVTLSIPKVAVQKKSAPSILYEDAALMIINKDSNTVSHPDEFQGFHLVHRLDKETSGALILAKTAEAKEQLEIAFKERKVTKKYLAIVEGEFPEEKVVKKGLLNKVHFYQGMSLYGSDKNKGKFAMTEFKLLIKSKKGSLVECTPVTGRTHQIRVHLKELKHPIVGDHLYHPAGKHIAKRHMLHAAQVQFEHPLTKEVLCIKAPLPTDFLQTLIALDLPYEQNPDC